MIDGPMISDSLMITSSGTGFFVPKIRAKKPALALELIMHLWRRHYPDTHCEKKGGQPYGLQAAKIILIRMHRVHSGHTGP